MSLRSHQIRILGCLMGLMLAGCAGLHPPVANLVTPETARLSRARLILQPRVIPARGVQTVIDAYTAATIDRLDVVPCLLDVASGSTYPYSASSGELWGGDDADLLRARQSSPSIDLNKPIVLDNIPAHGTYRIFARAYDRLGTLISSDASSSVDLVVTNDDRPTVGALPIKLADRGFSGQTTVRLSATGAANRLTFVTTRVFTVSDSVELALPNSGATSSQGVHPATLALTNLQMNTTYRIKASGFDASNAEIATAAVDVIVTNDDTPPPVTLALTLPHAVSTMAGSAGNSGSTNATGADARFNTPRGVAVDESGNVYVADSLNCLIRKITPAGVVTTLAGSAGNPGNTNATGTSAKFDSPTGVAVDASGSVYVADSNNNLIRKITPSGVVTTLAGNAGVWGSTNATGTAALFGGPRGVAVDRAGNVYVADYGNNMLRKITPAGVVTTLAGAAVTGTLVDATGTAARFDSPVGVAVDGDGNVFVADSNNHAIRKVTAAGVVTTLAGNARHSGSIDGTGSAAKFFTPCGVAVDAVGIVYVADYNNQTIRAISSSGDVTTLAGSAPNSGSADGVGSSARFHQPQSVTVDGAGNLYVADSYNHTVRKL